MTWITGTYHAGLNLLYWCTGNPTWYSLARGNVAAIFILVPSWASIRTPCPGAPIEAAKLFLDPTLRFNVYWSGRVLRVAMQNINSAHL